MHVQVHLQKRGNSVGRMPENTGDPEETKRNTEKTQFTYKNDVHKIPVGIL